MDSFTIRTTDGGQTWQKIADELAEAIYATSDLEAWVVWRGDVIRHFNHNGQTWRQQVFHVGNSLQDITLLNANEGWSVGGRGTIIYTSDGGNSWEIQHKRRVSYNMPLGTFIDKQNGWFAEPFLGRIWHTGDGGKTWEKQRDSSDVWLGDIEFVDTLHGWVVGVTIRERTPFLWRTTDGGNSWQEKSAPIISDLFLFDSLVGFASSTFPSWANSVHNTVANFYDVMS